MLKIFFALLFVLAPMGHSILGSRQAPMLSGLVEQGKLPPVDDRLPDEPMVVEPVKTIGKYGGTWRRVAVQISDTSLSTRMAYEPLVRWDRTGKRVVPGIAKSWEVLDGGRRYIFHLRKGMRWSDGHPFTSQDFLFFHQDVLTHDEFAGNLAGNTLLVVQGQVGKIETPDPYIVEYHFAEPYGIFLERLAFRGTQVNLFAPKHYLQTFHPSYSDSDELEKRVRQKGFHTWTQFFEGLGESDPLANPDLPTVAPYTLTIGPPAMQMVAQRNPYYWKVDPEGNQLPYIDRITFTMVQNQEIANFKAMTGDVDFQARRMNAAN